MKPKSLSLCWLQGSPVTQFRSLSCDSVDSTLSINSILGTWCYLSNLDPFPLRRSVPGLFRFPQSSFMPRYNQAVPTLIHHFRTPPNSDNERVTPVVGGIIYTSTSAFHQAPLSRMEDHCCSKAFILNHSPTPTT